jgi:fructose-1,6-bisphosphatase/inositol monophosphatase family enzyme
MGGTQGKFYVTSNPNSLDLAAADLMVQNALNFGADFDASSFRLLVSPSSVTGAAASEHYGEVVWVVWTGNRD